jgi:hypothetical protein
MLYRINTPDTQNEHSIYTEWTLQIHRMNTPDTQNEHSRYTEWTLQIHRMNTPYKESKGKASPCRQSLKNVYFIKMNWVHLAMDINRNVKIVYDLIAEMHNVTIQACLIYASFKPMTWQQPGFYANSVDIWSTDNM